VSDSASPGTEPLTWAATKRPVAYLPSRTAAWR
jgi:hypothetical protein